MPSLSLSPVHFAAPVFLWRSWEQGYGWRYCIIVERIRPTVGSVSTEISDCKRGKIRAEQRVGG